MLKKIEIIKTVATKNLQFSDSIKFYEHRVQIFYI